MVWLYYISEMCRTVESRLHMKIHFFLDVFPSPVYPDFVILQCESMCNVCNRMHDYRAWLGDYYHVYYPE